MRTEVLIINTHTMLKYEPSIASGGATLHAAATSYRHAVPGIRSWAILELAPHGNFNDEVCMIFPRHAAKRVCVRILTRTSHGRVRA